MVLTWKKFFGVELSAIGACVGCAYVSNNVWAAPTCYGGPCVLIGVTTMIAALTFFAIATGWPLWCLKYLIWKWSLRVEGREFRRGWDKG
jgi:hypothetical protein